MMDDVRFLSVWWLAWALLLVAGKVEKVLGAETMVEDFSTQSCRAET